MWGKVDEPMPPLRLSHLEVLEGDPPLVGRVLGRAGDQAGPAEAADRVAAVRVLGGGVDAAAAVEGGLGPVVLQLHLVHGEPAAGRHLVLTLAHGEAV